MRGHRLAIALAVAASTFLCLGGSALALSKGVVDQFFGYRMVRAEVILQNGSTQDWRIDRGTITAAAPGSLTIGEADGTSVTVPVQAAPRFARRFRVGARVVVYHPANGAAQLVQPEGAVPTRAMANQFFGSRMVRAEVILQAANGAMQDWRIDRGVVTAVAGGTVTIREADGTSVSVPVAGAALQSPAARFRRAARLRPGLRVVLYHQANQAAQLVQVEGFGQ